MLHKCLCNALFALTISTPLQLQDILKEAESCVEIVNMIKELHEGRVVRAGYNVVNGQLMYKNCFVISSSS